MKKVNVLGAIVLCGACLFACNNSDQDVDKVEEPKTQEEVTIPKVEDKKDEEQEKILKLYALAEEDTEYWNEALDTHKCYYEVTEDTELVQIIIHDEDFESLALGTLSGLLTIDEWDELVNSFSELTKTKSIVNGCGYGIIVVNVDDDKVFLSILNGEVLFDIVDEVLD